MKTDRRTFLKKFWKGLEIAGLVTVLSATREGFADHFNGLWDRIKEYTEIKGNLYMEKCTEDDADKAWEIIIGYSKENFPEILMEENEDINYWKLKELCRKNRKMFSKTQNIRNPKQKKITLGDIVADEKNRNFSYNGKNIKYDAIIFEREREIIPDGVIAWAGEDNTVYINLTKIKEESKDIYNEGQKIKNPKSFREYMIKEMYDAVMKETEAKNNMSFAFLFRYHEFENEFVRAMVESHMNHESMHSIYEYDDYRNEKETYLYEIAKDPKFNSYTFAIIYSYGEDFFKDIHKAFEDAGYTKERLMKMKPEERAKVAKELLKFK